MSIRNLDRIFQPQRIALVGVTPNPRSVGGTVLRNLVGAGFRGVVYPVSPTSEAVQGMPCFPDLASLPRTPDLAILCGSAAEVPDWVARCGDAGIHGLLIQSAGFREIGPEGVALEEQVRRVQARFQGMRILGPNCLGFLAPRLRLNASFALGMPKEGSVAFLSQSGALCTSVLDWAIQEGIGFSHFVSLGNSLDVDFADLIDYFGEDERTETILLYVESIQDARRFMTAARGFARSKPIVAYKAGRFPESAEAAASHTGAMAAADDVYDAAFRRAGIVRVHEIGEIFDVAELLGRYRTPCGDRLAIVTNAGGPGVMATDALIACQGVLANLTDESRSQLDAILPPMWSHGNPVDVLGDARPKRYSRAVETVLADPGVDAVLVILTPQAMTNPTGVARAIARLTEGTAKPLLAAWIGGASVQEGRRLLADAGVATYGTPEQAVRAFMTLEQYARNIRLLYETPREVPLDLPLGSEEIRSGLRQKLPEDGAILSEAQAKQYLEAYGIPANRPHLALEADQAVRLAERLGYPVVLKIRSPDISHKSDVNGVHLNLPDAPAVREAFDQAVSSARRLRPEARIEGITLSRWVPDDQGVELILGAKKDPTFGSVLMVGLGGVTAELIQDRALGFPPLNEALARRLLDSLRTRALLTGFRGRPPLAMDALIEAMIRLSYLVAEHPEIQELDINPLLVTPQEVIALDARILLDREALERPESRYRHLALRPYPEEYMETIRTSDGSEVLLRPIRPEDEPLWMELLGSCSRESIYLRFRHLFQWSNHEAAVRYCFIDYDREIAMVAEEGTGANRRLLGVGRLVSDPDLETVEFAVLVGDPWQDRGLGGHLTDACERIARRWGPRTIVATTTRDNPRMISLFRQRGYEIQNDPDGMTVDVRKDLR